MAEFTACRHADTGQVAEIATEALEGWQKLGWEPVSGSRTASEAQEQVARDETEKAVIADEVPDLTITQILDEVGDDPEKAQAALDAEQAREKPRKTLVDRLTQKAGQPGDPEGN